VSHTCPWWFGYFLLNPLRRLGQRPTRVLRPFVRPGMLVVEPSCGMGFFTLDLVRMVGPEGRVVAIDLQEKMLAGVRRRAARAGMEGRIDIRLARFDRRRRQVTNGNLMRTTHERSTAVVIG
jgi:tRNA A58 N-methylase Trm61